MGTVPSQRPVVARIPFLLVLRSHLWGPAGLAWDGAVSLWDHCSRFPILQWFKPLSWAVGSARLRSDVTQFILLDNPVQQGKNPPSSKMGLNTKIGALAT